MRGHKAESVPRRPKLDKSQQQAALAALANGMSEAQVTQSFGVSRSTITRLKRAHRLQN